MKVSLHPSLSRFVEGRSVIELPDVSINEFFSTLNHQQPQLYACLCDEEGDIRSYINVYVNGESFDSLPKQRDLTHKDDIDIVTSMVGG